jgi:hypothetical protein
MSYSADRRQNWGRKIVTHRPGISLAQTSFLQDRFQSSTPKNQRISSAQNSHAVALERSANSHQENFSSQAFVVAWLVPGKGGGGLHVGKPRRLTYVPGCLYSGVQPIRRMDACLSDHRLRPTAQMSGIFICLCLAN